MSFTFRIAIHVIVCQCVFEWLPNVISIMPGCNWSHVPPCPSSVGELDCFRLIGKHTKWQCVWDPGKALNISKYELLIEAPLSIFESKCKEYILTGTSVQIGKLKTKGNMAAYIADKSLNCTMATFKSPSNISRCCVVDVELKRNSGQLFVNASWDVESDVTKYFVKYREYFLDHFKNSPWMMELSQDRYLHTVKNVNSSMSYEVQVQCFNTSKCSQCALSKVYTVPQELTRAPKIKNPITDNLHLGRRKVTISWESPSSVGVSQYSVRVQKVSKESAETFTTDSNVTSISLLLSHSAYYISLHSSNNVSQSPPAAWAIEPSLEDMEYKGTLSVTFNSNHSFNLLWSNTLNIYKCYTVEWFLKGDNATSFKSFYSNKKEATIDIEEGRPFHPYKRYVFLLHVKPNKEEDACNLKQLNNSDVTCGRRDAYFLEGIPSSAPGNVSQSSVTDSSVVIKWLPVPEEELCGFLLGYILHYDNGGTKSNVTVPPGVTSYKLSGLKSGSDYHVEVAAYTSRGEGKCSPRLYFQINPSDPNSWILAGVIIGTVILLLAVHLCCRLLNRIKDVLWPSIPNPRNSSAFQKIDRKHNLEALESMTGLKILEHWDSGPLHLTECSKEEQKNPANPEASPLLDKQRYDKSGQGIGSEGPARRPSSGTEQQECLPFTATNTDSTILECTSTDFGATGATDAACWRTEAAVAAVAALAACDPKPTVAFMSDYTTMELFQQATMAPQAKCHPCQPVRLAPPCLPPAGLDYVDQSHFNTVQSIRDENTDQTDLCYVLTQNSCTTFPDLKVFYTTCKDESLTKTQMSL